MFNDEIALVQMTSARFPSDGKQHSVLIDSDLENLDIYRPKVFSHPKEIKLVSLFCGAGGLDLGFKQAGFRTAIAFDFNESAVESFNRNHPGNVAQVLDIEKTEISKIIKLIEKKIPIGADIAVVGGPPCQGFSRANSASKADDPRNKLPNIYLQIVRALSALYNVHFVLIENVSGIKAAKHDETFKGIISEIKNLNFVPHQEMMDSVDYGVPQIRKRMILLGLRKNFSEAFKFPIKSKKIKTVGEVIRGFPEPIFFNRKDVEAKSDFHPNHWTMLPKSEKFREGYVSPSSSRSFKKIQWNLPSRTIAFGNREILVHPSGLRRLSIYEAMILQGFPKKFQLIGTLSAQVTQVSNAVPPPLAKAIAMSLRSALVKTS
jgi:DNA (cytosine-5)-methyltransferase 1